MKNTTITPLMCLNLKNNGRSISHPFSFNRFPLLWISFCNKNICSVSLSPFSNRVDNKGRFKFYRSRGLHNKPLCYARFPISDGLYNKPVCNGLFAIHRGLYNKPVCNGLFAIYRGLHNKPVRYGLENKIIFRKT